MNEFADSQKTQNSIDRINFLDDDSSSQIDSCGYDLKKDGFKKEESACGIV